jgi:hypothetical protein
MQRGNPLARKSRAEILPEQDEPIPYSFADEDQELEESIDEREDDAERADDDRRGHPELYRAGKIDAYLRYLKMHPQARDAEPSTLRPPLPARERSSYRFFDEEEPRDVRLHGYQQRSIRRPLPRAPRLSSRKPRPSRAQEIAVAAGLSLAIAGVTGLIVYDRTSGGTLAQTVTTRVSALFGSSPPAAAVPAPAEVTQTTTAALADPEPAPATIVQQQQPAASKKSVAIAQLEVEDASGSASSLVPLSLKADPGVPGQSLAFRLSGLPENAYLTAGTRVAGDAWMLRPGEEHGVKLMVPASQTAQFAISVEALEARTGDLAAPVKEIMVSVKPAPATTIEPAAAPASVTRNFNVPEAKPETVAPKSDPKAVQQPLKPDSAMPIPAPIEKTSVVVSDASQGLVRSGDKLMSLGDLTAARQFYARALDEGVSEAALRLGQTYDPAVFAEKNVQGLKPDPSLAMKYYLQAKASGVADAERSISGLEAWMQR